MSTTVLQVYEDKSGKLYFRSDLPYEMKPEDKGILIGKIQLAMMTDLRGRLETAVNACIRQLAFGAVMCASDFEAVKADFREDAARFLPPIREANEKMMKAGKLSLE